MRDLRTKPAFRDLEEEDNPSKLTSGCQQGGKSGLWYPGSQVKKGFQGENDQPVEYC